MSARHRIFELLAACVLSVIRPAWRGDIADWVRDQKIRISSAQNVTYAGTIYDPDRFPAISRLIFAFFMDAAARECIIEKPVQSAGTSSAFLACAHRLVEAPGNIIYLMDTREKARDKLKDTIRPIFDCVPALAKAQEESETDATATALRFGSGDAAFYIGGGSSSAALNSTPAAVVILDEQARHRILDGVSTIDLGRDRLTGSAAANGKLLVFSKPEREAQFERDPKSGALRYLLEEDTVIDAEYLSGDQRKYHCPCPHCGVLQEIRWPDIRWHHCNTAMPGFPPIWDKERIRKETYWQCPKCEGHVHEGEQKRAMVLAGKWLPTPRGERRQQEKFPVPHPGRWSAQLSALTDIAFENLEWGALALRWLDSQGDPGKLRSFFNAILGQPEPVQRSQDTTFDHLRKLIPKPGSNDPPPWRMRDDYGELTRHIPALSTQLDYIGMTVDAQKEYLKFRVRAHGKDGRSYLLDYGRLPDLPDVPVYMDQMRFETMDGVECAVYKCYIDVGHRYHEVLDLSVAHYPRIEGIKGDGVSITATSGGKCWPLTTNTKSMEPVQYHMIAASYWERHLYVDHIQHYDALRHRPGAPAMYFPSDVGDDYLDELTKMREQWENGKVRWVKVSSAASNDFGDCEKYGLVMDLNLGCRHEPVKTYQLKKR